MTLIDRIANALGYIKTAEVSNPAAWLQAEAAEHRWTFWDNGATDEANMTMFSKLSWVQTAVNAVAQTAATTALEVIELAGEDRRAVENHPFELLLSRPNPLMSRYELLESTFVNRALTGNAYWWLNRANANAAPDEVWVLPSQSVKPVPDERMFLRGYEYEADGGDKILLELHEVVHFRRYNPLNPFIGLSPLESLRFAARGDMAAQMWNYNYFDKDNAKMPGALAFAAPIPDSEWERMKADIQRQHGGTKRNLMMLRGVGDKGVSWVSMAMSQRDMQFLEGRNFNKEEIWAAYAPGLASMLAINATEANSTAGRKTFVEMGVWPHLVAVAEKITNDVLPVYGNNLRAEFEDIRVTDKAMELQEQQAFAQIHTIDEIRAEFYDAPPLGDERGMLLLAEIGRGPTPTEAPEQIDMAALLRQMNQGTQEGDNSEPQPSTQAEDAAPRNGADVDSAPADDAGNEKRQADKRREVKAFKRWVKARKNPDVDDFEAKFMSRADKLEILAEIVGDREDGAAEDNPFPVTLPELPTPGSITPDWLKAMTLQLDPNDDEAEQLARMAIERRTERQMRQSLEEWLNSVLSGLTEDEVQNIAYMLRNNQMRFRDVLQRALVDSADLGVSVAVNQLETIGYGFDYTLANAEAREWARRYTDDVLVQLNTTNDRIVGEAVARWIDNGEPLQSLVDDLRPYFGQTRAQRIAATEVTRAYAEANTIAYQETGVVDRVEWRTAADERVCPVCGPMSGQTAQLGQRFTGDMYPPAHPNCRCWVVPVIDTAEDAATAQGQQAAAGSNQIPYKPDLENVRLVERNIQNDLSDLAKEIGTTPDEIESKVLAEMRAAIEKNPRIRVYSGDASKILEDGRFKTQFEIQSSGGAYNPRARAAGELRGMGVPENIDNALRPVYGYFETPMIDDAVSMYGDIEFVLKPETLNRTTVTLGDSLDPMQSGRVIGEYARDISKRSFGDIYRVREVYEESWEYFESYVEAQIHGGVSISDVAEIVIHAPDYEGGSYAQNIADLLRIGQEKGITVRYAD